VDFRALLPKEWTSGLNSPFDPIAAKEAESLGIEVAIMNGRNTENLKNYLNGKKFIGTIIK
jgi:uridylate kinase